MEKFDRIFTYSQERLRRSNFNFKRYFYKTVADSHRLRFIIGPRGIGKTECVIQSLKDDINITGKKALYISCDHSLTSDVSLYDLAEYFYNLGIKLIAFDEIHLYDNFPRDIKSIYDTFPKLRVICTGSSAMKLTKSSYDLSRRAEKEYVRGLSLREFLNLKHKLDLKTYTLEDLTIHHQDISIELRKVLEEKELSILCEFKEFLQTGYFAYFCELNENRQLYYDTLNETIDKTLFIDLAWSHDNYRSSTIKKVKNLLYLCATHVPQELPLKEIKKLLNIANEATLKEYLYLLEESNLLNIMLPKTKALDVNPKPSKIYLSNTNFMYSLSGLLDVNFGNLRETFFTQSLKGIYRMNQPLKNGDFLVDNKYTFEIGGKQKTNKQIRNIKDSYLGMDDIILGVDNKIPLWLFGFLY